MKILIYNFVQYDDLEKRGGGVSVYLNNLVNALLEKGEEIYFLSSGTQYDILNNKPRLEVRTEGKLTRLVIFNSPFLAPASSSFYRPDIFTTSTEIDIVAKTIFEQFPDIEIFHFHNIEGLTFNFIKTLKQDYIAAKFLFSVHNYNLLCMQVNLWYAEKENCISYELGNKCLSCIEHKDNYKNNRKIKKVQTAIQRNLKLNNSYQKKVYFSLKNSLKNYRNLKYTLVHKLSENAKKTDFIKIHNLNELSEKFMIYRATNIEICNNLFDTVICVSARTRDIMISYGVKTTKLKVLYIGTKFYGKYKTVEKKADFTSYLSIGYLGYMRKDKGFDFFIENINKLDVSIQKKLNVVIAAQFRDLDTINFLKAMESKFNSFSLYDGYTHATLPKILEKIDLGIIPVQWEDNLPQVAIEFVCNGIPILTSDLGGASEIAQDSKFIFKHSNELDFSQKIISFIKRETLLADFWINDLKIFSMSNHLEELFNNIYQD